MWPVFVVVSLVTVVTVVVDSIDGRGDSRGISGDVGHYSRNGC